MEITFDSFVRIQIYGSEDFLCKLHLEILSGGNVKGVFIFVPALGTSFSSSVIIIGDELILEVLGDRSNSSRLNSSLGSCMIPLGLDFLISFSSSSGAWHFLYRPSAQWWRILAILIDHETITGRRLLLRQIFPLNPIAGFARQQLTRPRNPRRMWPASTETCGRPGGRDSARHFAEMRRSWVPWTQAWSGTGLRPRQWPTEHICHPRWPEPSQGQLQIQNLCNSIVTINSQGHWILPFLTVLKAFSKYFFLFLFVLHAFGHS